MDHGSEFTTEIDTVIVKCSWTQHLHVPKHSNMNLQIISKTISYDDSGDKTRNVSSIYCNKRLFWWSSQILSERVVATDFNSGYLSCIPQMYVRRMADVLKWQHWAIYGASWKNIVLSVLLLLCLFCFSFVWSGVVWWTLNYPQKGPTLWKSFPCHEVIGMIAVNSVVNCIVASCELFHLYP